MNKLTKILSVLMVVIMLTVAISPIVEATTVKPSDIKAVSTTADDDIKKVGNKILGMITTVAAVAAVIVIAILGIKYIVGSTEEKANYKKAFMPYIIGLLLVVMASQIANWIWTFAGSATN